MNRRCGYTLIECLVTIALIGTAMTAVAVSMSSMRRACQRVRNETADDRELQRFAAQLRADAHPALAAEKQNGTGDEAPADTILLTLGDEDVVQYRVRTDKLLREHRRGDQVLHRETYRLPRATATHWQVNADGATPIVSLEMESEPSDRSVRPTLQVSAAVGLLTRPAAETKH